MSEKVSVKKYWQLRWHYWKVVGSIGDNDVIIVLLTTPVSGRQMKAEASALVR
jgi:hypothetical protein